MKFFRLMTSLIVALVVLVETAIAAGALVRVVGGGCDTGRESSYFLSSTGTGRGGGGGGAVGQITEHLSLLELTEQLLGRNAEFVFDLHLSGRESEYMQHRYEWHDIGPDKTVLSHRLLDKTFNQYLDRFKGRL